MIRCLLAASSIALLGGCHLALRPSRALRALENEGEVVVYLEPFPQEADRLAFSITSVSALGVEGVEMPLGRRLTDLTRAAVSGQRLLASGRLPPGDYAGFAIRVARATLATEQGTADLLVSQEATRVPAPFTISSGRSTMLAMSLRYQRSVEKSFQFTPVFAAFTPERPIPQVVGFCSNAASANVTMFDKQSKEVGAVLATGAMPQGIALDRIGARAYVALSDEDEVEVLDVASAQEVARIRLGPGDRPVELALAPDGRTLLVVNRGSNSMSFVDLASLAEVDRVLVGDDPVSLLLDPGGQRAYVLNRRSNGFTVVDVARRAAVTAIATDPEPLRAQIDRAGTRLYVIHAASPYMTTYTLPALAVESRIFVGMGASAVRVDPRTDLVYVSHLGEKRLDVYHPSLLTPVDSIEIPGGVSYLAIDDVQNALFVLMPALRSVVAIELTSRQVLGAIDVGDDPYLLVLAGGRE